MIHKHKDLDWYYFISNEFNYIHFNMVSEWITIIVKRFSSGPFKDIYLIIINVSVNITNTFSLRPNLYV